MSRGSTYGISRVDNETSRTHGWLVTISVSWRDLSQALQRRCVRRETALLCCGQGVSGSDHRGAPPLSMQEVLLSSKAIDQVWWAVCRYCASETRDLPEEKQRWFWVASWPLPDGRRKPSSFRSRSTVRMAPSGWPWMPALPWVKLVGAFDPGVRRRTRRRSPQVMAGS